MGDTQLLPNQQSTEPLTQQQANQNNSKLFVVTAISILLTGLISGLIVFFWQKSANEKTVSSLVQRISFLEEQTTETEMTKVEFLDDVQKTQITVDMNEYETEEDYFKYPADLTIDPNKNLIVMYDPAKFGATSSVVLTDINDNEIIISKPVYLGAYGDGWGYGPGWEEDEIYIEYDSSINISGLNTTIISQKTPSKQNNIISKIYLLSDENYNFTYEITINTDDKTFFDKAEVIVSSIKNKIQNFR